jgi:hypothetical protein
MVIASYRMAGVITELSIEPAMNRLNQLSIWQYPVLHIDLPWLRRPQYRQSRHILAVNIFRISEFSQGKFMCYL